MKNVHRNFLSLPNSFESNSVPTGSSIPSGIIAKIKSEVSDVTSYIDSMYDGTLYGGDVKTLVNWDSYIHIYNTNNIYLQVEFKHGYVYPTSYSFKGYNGNLCFQTEWLLYGFNTLDEGMTIVSENKSEGTTFCTEGQTGCYNGNWATYAANSVDKAFKYFRLVQKSDSCKRSYKYLLLGGFELFGLYSIDGRTLSKNRRNRANTCGRCTNIRLYSIILFTIYIS